MNVISVSPLLRGALLADAGASAVIAVLHLTAAQRIADLLVLPPQLLVASGAFLVCWTLLLALLARRPAIPARWVALVIAGNVGWSAACIALPASGAVQPGGLGMAYLLLQSVAVLVLAAMQFVGSRWAADDDAPAAFGRPAEDHR